MRFPGFVVIAALLSSFCLRSQIIDSNSVTVNVNRSIALRAEQVTFALAVVAGLDSDLTSITTALTAAGIQQANFTGVSDSSTYVGNGNPLVQSHSLTWNFTYVVPYGQLNDTLTKLSAVSRSIGGKGTGPSMTFGLIGTSVSDASIADARRKLAPMLVDDAKKEAALITDAAGLALGQILGIAEGITASSSGATSAAYAALLVSPGAYLPGGTASPTYTVTSALSVKFAAGH